MRRIIEGRLLLGCLSVSLLAGCQLVAAPGTMPARASFALGVGGEPGVATEIAARATHSGSLTVDFGSALGLGGAAARRVLATLADVERVVVTIKTADNATVSQTVERAAITAGQTTLTFSNLSPGAATVTVEAKDAQDHVIGATTQSSAVTAGTTSTVDILVSLAPTLTPVTTGSGGSTPTTGQLTTNVALQDGLVGIGPLAIGNTPADLEIDGEGNVWVLTEMGSTLKKFDSEGHALASFVIPGAQFAYYLDISPEGLLYVTNEIESGFVVDENGVDAAPTSIKDNMETNAAFDAVGNVVFGFYHSLELNTYKPDGTLVSTVQLPFVGGVLRRDPTGGYWVTSEGAAGYGPRIAKVSASGAIAGNYEIPDFVRDLEVDHLGNAWTWDGVRINRITPAGEVTQPIADGGRITVDGSGRLWVRTHKTIDSYDDSITKVASYSVPDDGTNGLSVVRFDAQGRAWVTNGNDGTAIRLSLP